MPKEKILSSVQDARAVVIYGLTGDTSTAIPALLNVDGSFKVDGIGLWDKVTQVQNATTDVWSFELASVATKTVTITYTDTTKEIISTVEIA